MRRRAPGLRVPVRERQLRPGDLTLASFFVIVEAGLGFLGLGVPPPSPSWGPDLANVYLYFTGNPYATVVPGVAISLGAWSISTTGDWVRGAMMLRA